MKDSEIYNNKFFSRQARGSHPSARVIVPLILDLMPVNSVVDVGCGLGVWLKVFKEHGVSNILGVDSEYVNKEELYIPTNCFMTHNLAQPLTLKKRFDLAISLEVVEHLPEDKAEMLIKTLTSLSDVIVFSAAIPGQGDVNIGHVNEQWAEYWQRLFRKRRYELLDPFRMKIFNNNEVDWWYQQNILLAVKRRLLDKGMFKDVPVYNNSLRIIYKGLFKKQKWLRR